MDSDTQKIELHFENRSELDSIPYTEENIEYNYLKEVLTLCLFSDLSSSNDFPEDVKELAGLYLDEFESNAVGAYSETTGDKFIKEQVANYILERDANSYLEDDEEVLLENNESTLLTDMLALFVGAHMNSGYGILIPYPSSPTIQQVVELCGFMPVPYYLTEADDHWTVENEALVNALEGSDCKIHCIFLENPGYPTGHLYSQKDFEIFFRFSKQHKVVPLAIENLQLDVHRKYNSPFLSSRKALLQMGEFYESVQLMSFFSPARSPQGDKGMHISYVDCLRTDKLVEKFAKNMFHSPATLHQIYLSLFLAPKHIRKYESFTRFENERNNFVDLLGNLAEITVDFFNLQPYMSCCRVFAGQCAFPKLMFPNRWISDQEKYQDLEENYCNELYKITGIYVIPGKAFGENHQRFHFKFTFPLDQILLHEQLEKIRQFHQKFIQTIIT